MYMNICFSSFCTKENTYKLFNFLFLLLFLSFLISSFFQQVIFSFLPPLLLDAYFLSYILIAAGEIKWLDCVSMNCGWNGVGIGCKCNRLERGKKAEIPIAH